MKDEDQQLLRTLLSRQRVLSLGVLVDDKPHVGLLAFVVRPDFSAALVHASQLARHSRGLEPGAPFGVVIHSPDQTDADPLQLPRVSLEGTVTVLSRGTSRYESGRELFVARHPGSAMTFNLGDFNLYELAFQRGRLVAGFARASTVTKKILTSLGAA